ncbi:MAG: hypothetical protein K8T91_11990 [Planctomycetes bacterium]|nr:hypothetical protein [Planctomycetota bacterium]
MNLRIAIIVALVVLPLLGGCQQRQASKQMQTELRFQEDRIYQLEDWIRQYNEQLNSCRSENTSLSSGKPATATPKKAPLRISPFGDSEPKTPDIPQVEIPKVEIPPVEIPPTELPAPNPKTPAGNRGARRTTPNSGARNVRRPATGTPPLASGGRKPPVNAVAPAVALAAVTDEESNQIKLSSYEAATPQDSGIAGITLNRLLTVPVNRDGQPGDDGLMVVVEPRNHAGDLIPPAGELSVSLIDRAGESEAEAYVGRWHYSAAETTRLYRRTTLGDGIQLNLVWQDRKPTHSRLELYVRLKTPDGRKLEAKRLLDVALIPVSATAPVEPQRLQPEAEHVEPIVKTPVAKEESKPPVVKVELPAPKSDLFEVRPISEGDAPQKEKTAATPPAPTPLVESPKLLTATPVRPPTVVAEPRVAAAPAPVPIRSTPPAAPRPRKPLPVHPPAVEQVAIPTEPGTAAESSVAAEPAPPQPRPQWAPYRKQK